MRENLKVFHFEEAERIRWRYYKFWLNFEASIRVIGSTVLLCFGTKSASAELLEERKNHSSLIGAKNDILPIITNRLKSVMSQNLNSLIRKSAPSVKIQEFWFLWFLRISHKKYVHWATIFFFFFSRDRLLILTCIYKYFILK